eukprot:c8634_g1_i1 orf=251-472(-)
MPVQRWQGCAEEFWCLTVPVDIPVLCTMACFLLELSANMFLAENLLRFEHRKCYVEIAGRLDVMRTFCEVKCR